MAKAKRTAVRASKRASKHTSNRTSKRAPARRPRARKHPQKSAAAHPLSRRYAYTPELMAEGRRRYEETDESVTAIAADFGVHKTTFQRMANREHWVRYVAPARDLVPAVRLEAQAAALPPLAPGEAPLDVAAAAARVFRLVETEIAAAEAMQAQLARRPRQTLDGQRAASTLRSLNATLHSLALRQARLPHTGPNHDDIPRDLDALRDALAKRIAAFMASRGHEDFSGRGDGPAADRPVE